MPWCHGSSDRARVFCSNGYGAMSLVRIQPNTQRLTKQFRGARLIIAIAVLAGLCVRLAFGLGYWIEKPLTHDEREYLELAHSLATGQGFRYPPDADSTLPEEQFSRAPLYPAFVSIVVSTGILGTEFESSPSSLKIAQSIVGSIGVLIIAALSWRLAGAVAGATAAVIAAVYPPLVWICAYVLSETLYSTLALLTVLVLGLVTDRIGTSRNVRSDAGIVFVSGVLCALTALTWPPVLIFVIFVAVFLMRDHGWRLTVSLILGLFVILGPWTARNFGEHDRLIVVSAQGGVNFWIGNHPLSRGEGDMAANPAIKEANIEFRRRHSGLTAEELEPVYYREAFTYLADHPLWWAGLLARKFVLLWVPIGPSYTLHSSLYMWASVLSYVLALPFALAGAALLWRDRRLPLALGLMAAAVVTAGVLFFPQERFRIPILDPTLIVCAAVSMAHWAKRRAHPLA